MIWWKFFGQISFIYLSIAFLYPKLHITMAEFFGESNAFWSFPVFILIQLGAAYIIWFKT